MVQGDSVDGRNIFIFRFILGLIHVIILRLHVIVVLHLLRKVGDLGNVGGKEDDANQSIHVGDLEIGVQG